MRQGIRICAALSWLIFFLSQGQLKAQLTPELIQQQLTQKETILKYGKLRASELQQFYSQINYTPIWISKEGNQILQSFLRIIACADYDGLRPKDYHRQEITDYLQHTRPVLTIQDSLDMELMISLSAISYFRDLSQGNEQPKLGYQGLPKLESGNEVLFSLVKYIQNRDLESYSNTLPIVFKETQVLCGRLGSMLDRYQSVQWWDPFINNNDISTENVPLINKLYLLSLVSNPDIILPDSIIRNKIRDAQRMFNLPTDGRLTKQTLAELNVPIENRVNQLNMAINYNRWLANLCRDQPVIVVNIPSARLCVYQGNSTLLEMRMVLGKPLTPTPTLSSIIDRVVLYPYWHVPSSIAIKELLPVFKRDPDYVEAANYQVLNKQGKILNSKNIQWSAYKAGNFPFIIRQSTGCDNALGLLKLEFDSPFGVYLHDTPLKLLFAANKRFMSHGCMRMEKPLELGRLILRENAIAIDTLTEKGCLKNQSPIVVPAVVKMPVVVWYNPVATDETGFVTFYQDIYHKFE